MWLVDPVDVPGLEERLRLLGEPHGVLQLLDRHGRDCAALAARLDVPHREVSSAGTPFELVPVARSRVWREAALWWAERRTLVCADALGTTRFFRAPGESIGVHPLLRPFPPRRLAGFQPEHVLVGHGEGLHGPRAAPAVHEAIATARRRLPRAWLRALGALRS